MLTFALCDDEEYILADLKKRVENYRSLRKLEVQIAAFHSGESLLGAGRVFDIVLLDLKLPGINGMETGRRLRMSGAESQIVFITSYKDYVFQAFDLDAVHYLIKPVDDGKLYQTLDKAVARIDKSDGKALTINKGAAVQVIPFREIRYCEVVDHRLTIHTRFGDCEYFGALDALQNKLDGRFFRCHKSYLVNMAYVEGRRGDTVSLAGGGSAYVARRRQREFSQQLLSYLRRELRD